MDLLVAPLTRHDFAAFGDVVEVPDSGGRWINDGTALRFNDVARLVLNAEGGRPQASLFRVTPTPFPMLCRALERHPRSSQLFVPLDGRRFVAIVARGADAPDPASVRAFLCDGGRGVNYAPGTWHHPAIAIDAPTDFFVLGHATEASDYEVGVLAIPRLVVLPGAPGGREYAGDPTEAGVSLPRA